MKSIYKTASVYCLIDSRTNMPFYVGVTVMELKARLIQHVTDARAQRKLGESPSPKSRIVLEILDEGLHPIIQIIEVVAFENRLTIEKSYIKKFIEAGHELTNLNSILHKKHVIMTPFDFTKLNKSA